MEPVLGFLEEEEDEEDYEESRIPRSGLEYLRRVQETFMLINTWDEHSSCFHAKACSSCGLPGFQDVAETILSFDHPSNQLYSALITVVLLQLEATECPEVVVADISHKSFNQQTIQINQAQSHMAAPDGCAPSLEWQLQQAADFADLRQRMAHFKAKYGKNTESGDLVLPNRKDEDQWKLFCLGKQLKQKCSADDPEGEAKPDPTLCPKQEGTLPLFSILARMNQVTILQVLEYHVSWLEQGEYSHMQGRWLYSLLTCLEKPLLPESTSLLRTLVRHCAACRVKQMETSSQESCIVASLNLLIALVSRYFGQTDLADT